MSTALLGGITFVLVFAGIIFVHEFGHFIVARLLKIEVEEFGIGFPPRMLRLWRGKGSLLVGKDRLIIPINFDFPFDPKPSLHRPVNVIATSDHGRLVLRSISYSTSEEGEFPPDAVPGHLASKDTQSNVDYDSQSNEST